MLQLNHGELVDANANRSPTAYLANPAEERARYKHNTDKDLTLLKVLDADGRWAPLLPARSSLACMLSFKYYKSRFSPTSEHHSLFIQFSKRM